ncbi:MAG: DUF3600 domain-containing protein [Tumebacillaceae bacterium]
MSIEAIEEQVRQELRQQATHMQVPAELTWRVRNSFWKFQQEQKKRGNGKVVQGTKATRLKSKPLLAAALAGLIVLPTGAFAYSYMNDDLYGSFDQFKKVASIATKDMYMQFAMKLSGAKSQLGAEDYAKFIELLKARNVFVFEFGDKYGHINYDAMPVEKRASVKAINVALQPYFEKLNHQKQSSTVLTPAEFDQYIEADMTYTSILAQTGHDNSLPVVAKLPRPYQERFANAQKVLNDVNRKLSIHVDTPWEAKAKAVLDAADYEKFQDELQQMSDLSEQYGIQEANLPPLIDYDNLPASVRAEAKQLIEVDTTYRERIAKWKLSKEVLSPAEYDRYIEAKMDLETVSAKSHQAEVNGHTINPDTLPAPLRERFVQAKQVMDDVEKKLSAK